MSEDRAVPRRLELVDIDTTGWESVGRTTNTQYFRLDDRLLVALPDVGTTDTAASATDNFAYQAAWFEKEGAPGSVLVFFDRMANQEPGARRVYAAARSPWVTATALIGGTMLGRAMASFFMGLSRPKMPTRMFGNFDEALSWAQRMNASQTAEVA